MKIYFAGSIRGGRDDKELYFEIIKHISQFGQVLTEHLGNSNLTSMGESISSEAIFKRDIAWLTESDVVVAEVTTPSLGVGYELAKAEELKKKIICLFRTQENKCLSGMIDGNSYFNVKEYTTIDDAKKILESFLK
jgi:2'-deoxynucleoside 5'-phosphate N-hydrolase